ncbi:peroxidase A2-like [Momordica charantia]|uniref:Peroxidase n=1 Tax=Momordica charantia TaxID=3673 RepID=A0A6J1DLR6_MOMCH|nr:peroxidase A2-like [Momordica charantia]
MSSFKVAALVMLVGIILETSSAQLSPTFYDQTCPNLSTIVRDAVSQAQEGDVRAGAKLIRFHFHDCFVDGCDGSVLLKDAPGIESELDAPPNRGIQGLEIVDKVKAAVEAACPATVSCADILAIAALQSVLLTGGPSWEVQFGRRDSRIANRSGAESGLPSPFDSLPKLKLKFAAVGLDSTDLVALSGAHTFGRAKCRVFAQRLNNFNGTGSPDPTLDPTYRDELVVACPTGELNNQIALDVTTPDAFDNSYFTNLRNKRGLLQSDQELFSTFDAAETIAIVTGFAGSQSDFFAQFGRSMINMGNISPLTGTDGEIRLNCGRVNPLPTIADE